VRITHLGLRNWRTLKNLDVALGERLIIVGANASGKSNLLDSIRFIRDLTLDGGGLQQAVRDRGGISHLRCLYARNNNRGLVSVFVDLGDDATKQVWRYELSIKGEKGGLNRPIIASERVMFNGDVILDRPDEADRSDPDRLTQTALEQISANKEFRDIAEFFSATRYLHLVPQIIRDPGRGGDVANDPFGGDFIIRMYSAPARRREIWLRRITDALKIAVPQFDSLQINTDETGRPHLQGRYANWRGTGSWQDERELGDGTLRLVGLLWTLVEGGRKGALVLLEEPELSLHPEVVRVLPRILARAQRSNGSQVLLTTHSPDLLADEGVRPDEVLVLTVTDDGSVGSLLSDDADATELIQLGFALDEVVRKRSAPANVEQLALADLLRG